MYDDLESGGTPSGSGGTPKQPIQGGGTAGDSGGGASFEAVLKRLNELDGLVRSMQSGKDKGVAKVQGEVESLREQVARYEKLRGKGLDPDDALDRLEVEQMLAERRRAGGATGVSPAVGGGTPAPGAKLDHRVFLEAMGLDQNDGAVIQALAEGGDVIGKWAQIAASRKQRPAPTPTPAQQMPVPTGQSVAVTTDSLAAKYREITRGLPSGDSGVQARFNAKLAIRKEATDAGVPSPV